VRNRQKLSVDHLYKIGAKELKYNITSGLQRPLAAETDISTVCTIAKSSFNVETVENGLYETQIEKIVTLSNDVIINLQGSLAVKIDIPP
jgi:hypothetical protein